MAKASRELANLGRKEGQAPETVWRVGCGMTSGGSALAEVSQGQARVLWRKKAERRTRRAAGQEAGDCVADKGAGAAAAAAGDGQWARVW